MSQRFVRYAAATVLAALIVLAAAPVRAEGLSFPGWRSGEVASTVWSWLASLWSGQDTDPEGEDGSNAGATVQGDHGCGIDPDGRCTP